ncbi:MAG: hypothetical protein M3Y49_18790 [Actinomycetota bacterium]|nr:hypothetical protein [Actinomycetota bacterium]
MTSLGAALGNKIGLYAAARAAGMTSATSIDTLASRLCSRLTADHTPSGGSKIGPWLANTYNLHGNAAALVAVAAIKADCPQFDNLVGQ